MGSMENQQSFHEGIEVATMEKQQSFIERNRPAVMLKQQSFIERNGMTAMEKQQSLHERKKMVGMVKHHSFIERSRMAPMEKHPSFIERSRMAPMEKHPSFIERSRTGAMEKQVSFKERNKMVTMEKQVSFSDRSKSVEMEKQQSFLNRNKAVVMEKQQSFREKKKSRESAAKRGDSELHLAARAGNLIQVKAILQGSDDNCLKELTSMQNQDGETVMYVAAENGHVPVVSELLKVLDAQSAALKAKNGYDAFHIAAKQGHLEVLKELSQSFPDLAMTTDSSNSTALHTAATQGHADVVDLLLETDASLAKIAKNNGKTALHSAARMGHLEVVTSLLSKDSEMGFRRDKKGQTALHMAVKGQSFEVVFALIKPELAVISVEDNKGNTALHIATRKGRTQILQALLSVEGIDVNAINKAGETALDIAEKSTNEELAPILRDAGAVTAKDHEKPPNSARQLKQTVSDIKHGVQSQLQQTRQTRVRVQKIAKRLKKLHIGGLNNAINSATVVAVLIATVAFAAIFQVPGQYIEKTTDPGELGQAYIAKNAAFIIFLIFDSVALFISLAVVVVQTSVVVIEKKAKEQLMFVINKLMWMACLFISVAFISLTYVVVGQHAQWLARTATVIGAVIMLTTLGSMCYFVILHRIEESKLRNIKRAPDSRSRSWSVSVVSDPEHEYKRINDFYKQLSGTTKPQVVPLTFSQKDWASRLPYVSVMSCSPILVYGDLTLQSNFMATLVVDVPLMFLEVTLLSFMPEPCRYKFTSQLGSSIWRQARSRTLVKMARQLICFGPNIKPRANKNEMLMWVTQEWTSRHKDHLFSKVSF